MDQKPNAKAIVSFEATDEVDFSYKAGDVVKVIKLVPGIEWWKVELNGKTGMVHEDSFELYKYMVVADNLQPQEGDLQLNSGDLIDIVGVQKYKWIGKNQHGQEGSVDPKYVKQLPPFPKKTDTLDRIIPHEILVDLRKDRPRKASRSTVTNSPRAHTVDIVEVTEECDDIPVEVAEEKVELRPNSQRPFLPWMQELSDKNKSSSLFSNHVVLDQKTTPKIRSRELPKNFSKIKDMWNQSATQVTSTSTVRSSWDNGVLRKSIRNSFKSQELPGNAKSIQRSSLTRTVIQNDDMNGIQEMRSGYGCFQAFPFKVTNPSKFRQTTTQLTETSAETEKLVNNVLMQLEKIGPIVVQPEKIAPTVMQPEKKAPFVVQSEKIAPIVVQQEKIAPTVMQPEKKAPFVVQSEKIAPIVVQPEKIAPTVMQPEKKAPFVVQSEKIAPIVVQQEKIAPTVEQPEEILENAPPLPKRAIPILIPDVSKHVTKEQPLPKLPESQPPKLPRQCAIPVQREARKLTKQHATPVQKPMVEDDPKQIATLTETVRELQEENMEMKRRMSTLEKMLEFLIDKVLS